jgi:hypothetical protein
MIIYEDYNLSLTPGEIVYAFHGAGVKVGSQIRRPYGLGRKQLFSDSIL